MFTCTTMHAELHVGPVYWRKAQTKDVSEARPTDSRPRTSENNAIFNLSQNMQGFIGLHVAQVQLLLLNDVNNTFLTDTGVFVIQQY